MGLSLGETSIAIIDSLEHSQRPYMTTRELQQATGLGLSVINRQLHNLQASGRVQRAKWVPAVNTGTMCVYFLAGRVSAALRLAAAEGCPAEKLAALQPQPVRVALSRSQVERMDPARPMFASCRPGQYLVSSGSAIERAYGGRR